MTDTEAKTSNKRRRGKSGEEKERSPAELERIRIQKLRQQESRERQAKGLPPLKKKARLGQGERKAKLKREQLGITLPKRQPKVKEQRQKAVTDDTICFMCRETGHTVRDCPVAKEKFGDESAKQLGSRDKKDARLCYICGQKGHSSSVCPEKDKAGGDQFKFALCFVCGEHGHLAKQCSKNENGIYVKGGSCKICGSVAHLAKDCPDEGTAKDKRAAKSNARARSAGTATKFQGTKRRLPSGDDDEDDFV